MLHAFGNLYDRFHLVKVAGLRLSRTYSLLLLSAISAPAAVGESSCPHQAWTRHEFVVLQ
jgi:hypothetical protein